MTSSIVDSSLLENVRNPRQRRAIYRWGRTQLDSTWQAERLVRLSIRQLECTSGSVGGPVAMEILGQNDSPIPPAEDKQIERICQLGEKLSRYWRGEALTVPLEWLQLANTSDFTTAVLTACHAIPMGSVLTYGELAKQVGSPGAARAVGRVMSKNLTPLVVPCHRVMGSSGKLTGFSAPGGTNTKQWLLDHERKAADAKMAADLAKTAKMARRPK